MSRLALLAATLIAGCASGRVETRKDAPSVPAVRIAVVQDPDGQFSIPSAQAVSRLLIERGYHVVEDAAGADVLARVSTAATQVPTFFVFNGQARRNYSVRVALTLAAPRGGEVIEQLEATTHGSDGGGGSFSNNGAWVANADVSEKPLVRLVEPIGLDGRLSGYADELARAQRAQARREEQARKDRERAEAEARAAFARRAEAQRIADERRRAEEEAQAQQADQTAWAASGADACRSPASITACDAVRAYLKAHPEGAHAEDATQCLKQAEPVLAALQDQADWKAADVASCKRPERSDACADVEGYATKHPSGAHIAEAQRLLKAVAATLAELKSEEQASDGSEMPSEKTYQTVRRKAFANRQLAKVIGRVEHGIVENCKLQEQRWLKADRLQSMVGRDQVRAAYELERLDAAIELSKRRNGEVLGWAFEQLGSTGSWTSTDIGTGVTTESAPDPDREQLTGFIRVAENCFCPTEEQLGPCSKAAERPRKK